MPLQDNPFVESFRPRSRKGIVCHPEDDNGNGYASGGKLDLIKFGYSPNAGISGKYQLQNGEYVPAYRADQEGDIIIGSTTFRRTGATVYLGNNYSVTDSGTVLSWNSSSNQNLGIAPVLTNFGDPNPKVRGLLASQFNYIPYNVDGNQVTLWVFIVGSGELFINGTSHIIPSSVSGSPQARVLGAKLIGDTIIIVMASGSSKDRVLYVKMSEMYTSGWQIAGDIIAPTVSGTKVVDRAHSYWFSQDGTKIISLIDTFTESGGLSGWHKQLIVRANISINAGVVSVSSPTFSSTDVTDSVDIETTVVTEMSTNINPPVSLITNIDRVYSNAKFHLIMGVGYQGNTEKILKKELITFNGHDSRSQSSGGDPSTIIKNLSSSSHATAVITCGGANLANLEVSSYSNLSGHHEVGSPAIYNRDHGSTVVIVRMLYADIQNDIFIFSNVTQLESFVENKTSNLVTQVAEHKIDEEYKITTPSHTEVLVAFDNPSSNSIPQTTDGFIPSIVGGFNAADSVTTETVPIFETSYGFDYRLNATLNSEGGLLSEFDVLSSNYQLLLLKNRVITLPPGHSMTSLFDISGTDLRLNLRGII